MSSERMLAMGRYAELQQALLPLKIQVEETRESMRVLLMTNIAIEEIRAERVAALSVVLAADVGTYRAALEEMARLKQDHGL